MKLSKIIIILFSFVFISNTDSLLAAGGEVYKNLKPGFSFEGPFGKFDRQSLKRGYQVYSEVCASCHGMKQLSFRNLSQPGGPEFSIEKVKEIAAEYFIMDGADEYGDPIERTRIPSDRFQPPFDNKDAAKAANNGAYPPDLSLITKARSDGTNYIYSLLVGYEEAIPESLTVSPCERP